MPPRRALFCLAACLPACLPSCYAVLPTQGGGEAEFARPREVRPDDVAVPPGYAIDVVATGLTFPTGVALDAEGVLHVVEAGYAYGPARAVPRLLRIEAGRATEVARGGNAPWNGVTFANGAFYIAAGGHRGQILRVVDGVVEPVVTDLPSFGDHHTNGPVLGPDGWIYFGQGTATNSGVVGTDNHDFGWLAQHPEYHDVPGADVMLHGHNFTTDNPLTASADDEATTGAFQPFGVPSEQGQVVRGQTKCTGAVLRAQPDGGGLELVAWGFRNPFGLAFSPQGALYVSDNGFDERGSRPVFGAPDLLWRVEPGLWYGWPDYAGGVAVERLDSGVAPLLVTPPNEPPHPVARLAVHASACGLDFSRSERFGRVGQAFLAQFGDMAPAVGGLVAPVGFDVVAVDVDTGAVVTFAANRAGRGPASYVGGAGLERPVSVRFSPDGSSLYVVDFGALTMDGDRPVPHPGTGVVWRIFRSEA